MIYGPICRTFFIAVALLYPHHLVAAAEPEDSAGAESAIPAEIAPATTQALSAHFSHRQAGGFYLSLFGGNDQVEATQVTATTSCILCFLGSGTTTVSKQVDNWSGSEAGLRFEGWFAKGAGVVGIAYELVEHKANAPEVELSYFATSLIPMAGYTLHRSMEKGGGAVRLYVGVVIAMLQDGEATVRFAELPSPVSVPANMEGSGSGFLLGVAGHYPHLNIFAELRGVDMSVSGNYLGDEIKLSHDTRQLVAGIGFRLD